MEARAGYFAVTLNTSVRAEMTVSNHTALYRFTFPTDGSPTKTQSEPSEPLPYSPLILADLTDLSDSRGDARIAVDPATGRITGNGTFEPSFGLGTYALHFCADFQSVTAIRDTGVFQNNRAGSEPKALRTFADHVNSPPLPGGAWVQFHPPDPEAVGARGQNQNQNQILARVGLSFFSVDQACRNAERELPGFDFEAARAAAEEAWRTKLSPVVVDSTGVDTSLQRLFWSSLYRTFISPQDYTGKLCLQETTISLSTSVSKV